MAPIFNILVGVACVAAALVGGFNLFGSSDALVVAGVVAVGLGLSQLWRRTSR